MAKVVVDSKRPVIELDRDNNVYYNIKIVNRGDPTSNNKSKNSLAVYSVNRTSAILENPSDYELAVVRFSIPSTNIPIMVWGNSPYNRDTNPSSKVDKYIVSMEFNGTIISRPLVFIPNADDDLYGNTIWNYQEFIDILNVALQECFVDLKATEALAPPSVAPNFTFEPKTQLCSLYAPQTYDTGNPSITPYPPPPTIRVFFNTALFELFPSLQSYGSDTFGSPLNYQILIKNNYNNQATIGGVPYYFMEQEFSTLELWSDLQKIVFETDSIPVESEYQPTQNDTTRRIITDFEPEEGINDRQKIQYFGYGWKRYYDLKSTYPLNSIDLRAYWEDKDGQLFPIYLGQDEALSMKLLFRKKLPLQISSAFYGEDGD